MMIRLHYDGWFNLPLSAREQLGLGSGDLLELAVREGTVVLSPAVGTRKSEDPVIGAMQTAADGTVLVKRGRGRPRKIVSV